MIWALFTVLVLLQRAVAYDYAFIFGDSYSATGWTSSNSPLKNYNCTVHTGGGPNFLLQLAQQLSPEPRLINFAQNGAGIDNDLIDNLRRLDFTQQVAAFQTYFVDTEPSESVPWNSSNALFSVLFGVNDIVQSWNNATERNRYQAVINTWLSTTEELYRAGARHFVLNDVPPLDLAPIADGLNTTQLSDFRTAIADFNSLLANAQTALCRSRDVVCFRLDTNAFFTTMISNYTQEGFISPDSYCSEYRSSSCAANTTVEPGCEPRSAYIWTDRAHPSSQAHQLWGNELATLINRDVRGRHGLC